MIVFIAAIIVAATAAAVLLNTSTVLQSKSTATGDESTKQIASNLRVDRIVGWRNVNTQAFLEELYVYMSLAPGASDIDVKTMHVQWSSALQAGGDTFLDVPYSPLGDCSDGGYCYNDSTLVPQSVVRDLDSSLGATVDDVADPTLPSALSTGDILIMKFVLATVGLPTPADVSLDSREHVTFKIIPEIGGAVIADFNVPESFGSDLFIPIR